MTDTNSINDHVYKIKDNCIRLIHEYHPYSIFLSKYIFDKIKTDNFIVIIKLHSEGRLKKVEELLFSGDQIIPVYFDQNTVDKHFNDDGMEDIYKLTGINAYARLPLYFKMIYRVESFIMFENSNDLAKFKIRLDEKYL